MNFRYRFWLRFISLGYQSHITVSPRLAGNHFPGLLAQPPFEDPGREIVFNYFGGIQRGKERVVVLLPRLMLTCHPGPAPGLASVGIPGIGDCIGRIVRAGGGSRGPNKLSPRRRCHTARCAAAGVHGGHSLAGPGNGDVGARQGVAILIGVAVRGVYHQRDGVGWTWPRFHFPAGARTVSLGYSQNQSSVVIRQGRPRQQAQAHHQGQEHRE